MSEPVEFLITFAIAVGLPFIAAAVLGYFGYTQKPKSRGLIALAGGLVALAFLAGIGTILFFAMVPQEVRNRQPSPVNEGADYQREVDQRLGRIGLALERIAPLLLAPRLADSEWQDQVATQAAVIQLEYEVINRMNPPPDKAQSHRALLDALGNCDRSMDRLMIGIERIDSAALAESNELMQSCNKTIEALN